MKTLHVVYDPVDDEYFLKSAPPNFGHRHYIGTIEVTPVKKKVTFTTDQANPDFTGCTMNGKVAFIVPVTATNIRCIYEVEE